jgi:hypothetical protein
MARIFLLIFVSLLVTGCDIGVRKFIVLKPAITQGSIVERATTISVADVNSVIGIADTVATQEGFVKIKNSESPSSYSASLASYEVRKDVMGGALGFWIHLGSDREILTIEIGGLGGYDTRKLGLKLSDALCDRMCQEFGESRVLCGSDWEAIAKQLKPKRPD